MHTLEAVAGQILTDDISEILDRVESEARMEGRYFMCKQDGMLEVAALLQNVKALSLEVRTPTGRPGAGPQAADAGLGRIVCGGSLLGL